MNFAERLAGVYLRLNGFFLMPEFSTFSAGLRNEGHAHVDILAFRPRGAYENLEDIDFPLDAQLFDCFKHFLDKPFEENIGVVCEVRSNDNGKFPANARQRYAMRMCGLLSIIPLCCDRSVEDVRYDPEAKGIRIGLQHAIRWIGARIAWLDYKGIPKSESWNASEPGLADLLVLNSLQPLCRKWTNEMFVFPREGQMQSVAASVSNNG